MKSLENMPAFKSNDEPLVGPVWGWAGSRPQSWVLSTALRLQGSRPQSWVLPTALSFRRSPGPLPQVWGCPQTPPGQEDHNWESNGLLQPL